MWSRQRFQQMRWSIFAGVAFLVTLAVFLWLTQFLARNER